MQALIIIPAKAESAALDERSGRTLEISHPWKCKLTEGERKVLECSAGIDYSPDTRPMPPRAALDAAQRSMEDVRWLHQRVLAAHFTTPPAAAAVDA